MGCMADRLRVRRVARSAWALALLCVVGAGCTDEPSRVDRAKSLCHGAGIGSQLTTWQPTTVGHIRHLVVGPQPKGRVEHIYGDAFPGASDKQEAAFCWSSLGKGTWQSFAAGPDGTSVKFGMATGFTPARKTGPELPI
jgi:hypothetical protein